MVQGANNHNDNYSIDTIREVLHGLQGEHLLNGRAANWQGVFFRLRWRSNNNLQYRFWFGRYTGDDLDDGFTDPNYLRFEVCAPENQGLETRGIHELAGYPVFRKPEDYDEHAQHFHVGLDMRDYPFNDPNREDEQRERMAEFITQCFAALKQFR